MVSNLDFNYWMMISSLGIVTFSFFAHMALGKAELPRTSVITQGMFPCTLLVGVLSPCISDWMLAIPL